MVSVVIDTQRRSPVNVAKSRETKAIVYVTQPYILNLNYADGLRQEIDVILDEDTMLTGTQTTQLNGLPVSLDINKGIHDTQTNDNIDSICPPWSVDDYACIG